MATIASSLGRNFLGSAPRWYKLTILGFLLLNPIVLILAGGFVAGWLLVAEFIFTLAMALTCYPLQPGGLLAIEAVAIGLATPAAVFHEAEENFSVILLLIFMVAGIYFLRDLLLAIFAKLFVGIRSKVLLSVTFVAVAAVLSAFLDALTVTAVIIAVATGFYSVYHRVASQRAPGDDHDHADDAHLPTRERGDLEQFRAFLRSLIMHGLVGTALGGVATLVGEPQNLLIGETVGWGFMEFFVRVAPISIPVFVVGLGLSMLLERFKLFGYGAEMPDSVREVLVAWERKSIAQRTGRERARLAAQGVTAVLLVLALAFHVAEVGLVGLAVIIISTAFTGITDEHALGRAFTESLPFTALLVTFFAVVAVIHTQDLFAPVIDWVLSQEGRAQLAAIFGAAGILSAISDNVFVATVYITEVASAFDAGELTRAQFEQLAIAINTGTNIPSIATPNGQAAFLFMLTSGLAPLIRLGYGRMLWMALPYAVILTAVALGATVLFA